MPLLTIQKPKNTKFEIGGLHEEYILPLPPAGTENVRQTKLKKIWDKNLSPRSFLWLREDFTL